MNKGPTVKFSYKDFCNKRFLVIRKEDKEVILTMREIKVLFNYLKVTNGDL